MFIVVDPANTQKKIANHKMDVIKSLYMRNEDEKKDEKSALRYCM